MSGVYDPVVDYSRSWHVGVTAARYRHHAIVKFYLPALRRARYGQGLTIERLAPAIGVSWSTLQSWENGYPIPPPHLFDRWRDLLGV